MKPKCLILLCLLMIFSSPSIFGQISEGGTPISFTKQLGIAIDSKEMPYVDIDAYLAEDEIEMEFKDIPMRFGAPFDVSFNNQDNGTWERLADGTNVWRLKISSPGALSINIVYDVFEIPDGSQFYLYNEDRSMVIGAFTSRNNKEHKEFATSPVKGDVIILEYIEPADIEYPGYISLRRVVHAYRNFFSDDFYDKGFGSSGSCNNNVNCPEGADWQNEKRSVAMVLLGSGYRYCSGSMINNVRQDLTPYFLTANHCLNNPNTFIIMFNYESPGCTNVDGPTWMTVQGTTTKANNSFSDVALLLLNETPPDSYQVYYAGWNAIDTAADNCVAIHHPAGDIKKISFNTDPLTSTSYLGATAGDGSHWRVDDWEDGTTEGGSSGSPIYDSNHRVLGQLHGGYASCASITSDWYGKFSVSWNYGSSSTRLKDWLDPDNTGTLVIDGIDAAGIKITHSPLLDTKDSLNDYEVLAAITSNVALVPSSLLLKYEVNSNWYDVVLSSTGGANEFNGFIPAQSPGTSVSYFLQAEDIDGNADTTDTFTFRVLDYGFTMTPDYQEKTTGANDIAWYDLNITNIAVYDDDYSLNASGNFWTTTFWNSTGTVQIYSTGYISADESFSYKVKVEVPASLYGDFDLTTITATSDGDPSITQSSTVKTISAGEPFQIPFTDNFPILTIDIGHWIYNSNATSNSDGIDMPSEPYCLNLDGNPVGADTVISQLIYLKNKSGVNFSYYYQRTGSANSPEPGDDLFFEYKDSLGNWQLLSRQYGDGPDMVTFEYVTIPLPGDAYHSAFQLRIRNIGTPGTTGTYDDWFVDDISIESSIICGDVNGDGAGPTISDLTYLVAYLFSSGPPPPVINAADVNNDGAIGVSDVTYIVDYMFSGGPEPVCD